MLFKIFYCISIYFLIIQTPILANEWMEHWFKGLKYEKENKISNAIEEYTLAINSIPKKDNPNIYNLYEERGHLYILLGYIQKENYKKAIEDFNFVIKGNDISEELKKNAILGRAQANLALGNFENFQNDIKNWEISEPFCIDGFQENNEYVVFKLANDLRFNKSLEKAFIQMIIAKHYVENESEIIFSSSGIAVIKKTKDQKVNWGDFLNCHR